MGDLIGTFDSYYGRLPLFSRTTLALDIYPRKGLLVG